MTLECLAGAMLACVLLSVAGIAAEAAAACLRLPRRWVWAAAMWGSLLLPLAAVAAPGALPRLHLPRVASHDTGEVRAKAPTTISRSDVQDALAGSETRLPAAAYVAWLAASLALLAALAGARRRLERACGACVVRRLNGARVLVAERAGPFVLGCLDARIILPKRVVDGPQDELRAVLRHELEHVRAGDPWLLAVAALAIVAMPWNVALWWQNRRLRLAVEMDCDARVLASGECPRTYGRVLLSTAAHPFLLPAPVLAWSAIPSHLERRIIAMTSRSPRNAAARALPLAALASAALLAACGAAASGVDLPASEAPRYDKVRGRIVRMEHLADGSYVALFGPEPGRGTVGLAYAFGEAPRTRNSPPPTVLPTVRFVGEGSAAEQAGLRPGDVLVSANGRDMRREPLALHLSYPGSVYDLRVRRNGAERGVRLVTGPPPTRAEIERHMEAESACLRAADREPDPEARNHAQNTRMSECFMPY